MTGDPRSLGSLLDESLALERRTALRRLLRSPLLSRRQGGENLRLIVRHRDWLANWFAQHAGWTLIVDAASGFARLHKVSARLEPWRPAEPAGRLPFDRRRYVLLCLTLAALDECSGQITLRVLAESVERQSAAGAGLTPFQPAHLAERRAFVDVLRLLLQLGVLSVRDGETERYLSSQEGDALYDVHEGLLGQMPAAPVAPSLAGSFHKMREETYAETEDGARRRARHQVVRRLLDDPVLYWEDLASREREWLEHSLAYVTRILGEAGLMVERRKEGLAAIDPDGELTDRRFPDGGSTVKHAALLLAEYLTGRGRGNDTAPILATRELEALVGRLCEDYGRRCGWRKEYLEEDGARRLTIHTLEFLASLQLVRKEPEGWRPLPAIARFAAAPPHQTDRSQTISHLATGRIT